MRRQGTKKRRLKVTGCLKSWRGGMKGLWNNEEALNDSGIT